ncbi:gfo/Idh/MocA family oxidoreductase, partial [Paenibacillus sepulcri]|nr:gfo/Idh/MocA family oxidoreductase [Paenibacillus sepulcri]
HAARLEVVRSGKLGKVSLAEVAVAHDYHGLVLIRRFLDIGFENAVIRGQSFTSPIVEGRGRAGGPESYRLVDSEQTIATLDFGGKLGVYDFTGDLYFSWIRSRQVLVRGDHGEINNTDVRYLQDYRTPVHTELRRVHAGHGGDLEGHHLKAVLCGDTYVYRNEFIPGRLSDDEIAVAACLARMAEYVDGGPDFYSLAEACQDHYLGLMIQKAVKSGEAVTTETQCWAQS